MFPNGLEWRKADFHLHTRADRHHFRYEGDDADFTNRYIQSLIKANIGVGIITNHNTFNPKEFTGLRSKARKEGIILLPGVELSIKEGQNATHTLVVFADEWIEKGNDWITPFLTSVLNDYRDRTTCDLKENG